MTNGNYPKKFGDYIVVRPLSAGAYGQTFLVQSKNQVHFVLKWLKEGAAADAPARFVNEAWALRKLDYGAFPKFVAEGNEQGRPYIVMTFAEGKTIKFRIEENIKTQGHFHGLTTALIAQRILEGLQYLHNIPLIHRDIKDDNIMVSGSGESITIIDLGQCKGHNPPKQDETFWNIGAARFAPPVKLESPTASNKSHDVFAVGVICYRMLTNQFPWQVSASEDHGHLRTLMMSAPFTPIRDLNGAVDEEICRVIEAMIDTEDYRRIEVGPAIERIKEIRARLENVAFPTKKREGRVRLDRVVRDQVHGDIAMTTFEFGLINSTEFQRLRRLRQLGLAHYVYPGAEHSRFSHALGTLHVAEKILRSVEMRDGHSFEAGERQAVRAYALLHDISHAPFGHTLEDELGFFKRHDGNEGRIGRLWSRSDAQLGNLLQAADFARIAKDLIDNSEDSISNRWIGDLIGGPTGADVLDYIDRDSIACGLDHRVDSAIFRRFTLDKDPTPNARTRSIAAKLYGTHGFRLDADHAVTSILRERFALFMKVYSHPVKDAAGAMLGKALTYGLAENQSLFAEERVETMGDDELLYLLRDNGGEGASFIVNQILNRNIYKPVFRAKAIGDGDFKIENYREKRREHEQAGLFSPIRRHEMEYELAKKANVEARDVVIYCNRKAPGAKAIVHRVAEVEGKFKKRDGAYKAYQNIYNAHLYLWNMYLFVNGKLPEGKKKHLAEIFEESVGLANDIKSDRRQLALDLL